MLPSPAAVILIPKLRMQFAEFLNEGFLAHLRILSLPTCVGFSTGTEFLVRSFSRQPGSCDFDSPEGSSPCQFSAFSWGICLPTSLPPSTRYSTSALTLPSASLRPQTKFSSIGIFADCPSRMRLRLRLGPDLPRVDERCPGNLRLSVFKFLTQIFATHTGILSSHSSSCPSGQPSSKCERSPTDSFESRRFSSVL